MVLDIPHVEEEEMLLFYSKFMNTDFPVVTVKTPDNNTVDARLLKTDLGCILSYYATLMSEKEAMMTALLLSKTEWALEKFSDLDSYDFVILMTIAYATIQVLREHAKIMNGVSV